MKNFKKYLLVLFAITIFAKNLNSMYQEPQLNFPFDPREFDWQNPEHIQTLKELYNNNLRMIIIIACSVRDIIPIEDGAEIELHEGQRIIALHKRNKVGQHLVDEYGKSITQNHLIEKPDEFFLNLIDKLMFLIKQTTPQLFTYNDLLTHNKKMGLVKGVDSYLDQDPAQIRANNNLTTRDGRWVSGQGQVTREVVNVNTKFRQCLNNLETILELLKAYFSEQEGVVKKQLVVSPKTTIALREGRIRTSSGSKMIQIRTQTQNPKQSEILETINNLLNQIYSFYNLYSTPPVSPHSPKRLKPFK
ncbi:MAG: hypothetical protein ABIA74_03760 [bacterium]